MFKREKTYLLIPFLFITFWLTLYVVGRQFNSRLKDFVSLYGAGEMILNDPERLYEVSGYFYTPLFAIFMSLLAFFFNYDDTYYILLFLSYFSYFFCVYELDKILVLKKVNKKNIRILFLLILSGFFSYIQFFNNQTKIFLLLFFLIFVRREIQYKKVDKDLKYYFINFSLFAFIIGIAPYFIIVLVIYFTHGISSIKELFKPDKIKHYVLFLSIFILQNFLFLIYPFLFLEFIKNIIFPTNAHATGEYLFIYISDTFTKEWMRVAPYILYIFTFILIIIVLFIISRKNINLNEKFSYFSLSYFFLGTYSWQFILAIITIPFITFLFIPYLKEKELVSKSTKNYKLALIGLICAILISFLYDNIYLNYYIYEEVNIWILKWILKNMLITLIVCLMMSSLVILKLDKDNIYLKYKEIKSTLNQQINTTEILLSNNTDLFEICLEFNKIFVSKDWKVKIKMHKQKKNEPAFLIDVDMRKKDFNFYKRTEGKKHQHLYLLFNVYIEKEEKLQIYTPLFVKKDRITSQSENLIEFRFMIQ
ncbi:MAG: hypothetical protein ACFFAO_17400 [Candidatus Hermodarchaeota archaeon]